MLKLGVEHQAYETNVRFLPKAVHENGVRFNFQPPILAENRQQVARVSEAHPGGVTRESRVRPAALPGLREIQVQWPLLAECRLLHGVRHRGPIMAHDAFG
jgi:hypothetical protein